MCMISYYPEIDGNFLYIRTAVFRFYSMGYRSIRLFVEELRSKEVKVECEPYRLDGKMKMYPVREMRSNY